MKKKIFRSIWIVILIVWLASTVIILLTEYNHFENEQIERLRNEIRLADQGVALNGAAYFDGLEPVDARVTWITSEGKILYDTAADVSTMENHLEREEIKNAIETGYGESIRYSNTLSEKQIYVAEKLEDGTILRLACTQSTILNLFFKYILRLVPVFVIAGIISLTMASRLSKRVMEPINNIDLDDPMKYADSVEYHEIKPLLQHLAEQHSQIEADKAEIEKTSLIRQEFTANASHELKTPLHVISGYAELLENGMVENEDIPKFAGKIRSEAQRMTKIVEDIIDLSRLDSGGLGMKREMTDLYSVASSIVDSLRVTAENAGVELVFSGDHCIIKGIPQVIGSIVYNLTLNAINYSNTNGRVEVRTEDTEEGAVLKVSDNGIGISGEDINRIFERFYRVDKSHSKEVGGTGLGLSIVKHAAMLHNADISVESEVGKGSVFCITFPKQAE